MRRYFVSYQYQDKKGNRGTGSCSVNVNRFDSEAVSDALIKKNKLKTVILTFFKELKRYEEKDR